MLSFSLCVCVRHACGIVLVEIRGHLGELFSPSAMRALAIKLRLSGLAASALAH